MTSLLLIWIALAVALIVLGIGSRRDGGAFTLSYFISLSLIHVPGLLAYLGSSSYVTNEEETMLGFEMTLLGMTAFVLGASVVRLMSRQQSGIPNYIPPRQRHYFEQLSVWMIIAGFVSYFILIPIAKFVPSLTSLVAPFTALLILGLWWQLYLGMISHDLRRTLVPLLILPILPALTTIAQGFIGFGTGWALSVVSFFFVMVRRRIWLLALTPLVVYFGLSLFVSYMRDRLEIRELIWEQQAAFDDRVERLARTITNFEFLDFNNPDQILALDSRLNQNFYVGLAVQRYQEGVLDLKYGGTVPIWALIPRAIWPDKPDVGGGRTVVADVTGLDLAEGTSFGAGQVLEFYVNFGWPGVVVGFFAVGALFRWLDRVVMQSFNDLDIRRLFRYVMPGFVLCHPGSNLLELFVSVVAALLIAPALGTFFSNWNELRSLLKLKRI